MILFIRTRLTALLAFLSLVMAASAQQYRFRYYGIEDGLTNLSVQALFQDRPGFLWLATESGVFRYDGRRFEFYGPEKGLPRATVLALGEAPDGSVLVAYREGFFRLRKGRLEEGRFEKFPLPGGAGALCSGSIQYDGKGRTYFTTGAGLVIAAASAEDGGLQLGLLPTPAGAGGADARGLLVEQDTVWYGCHDKICRVSPAGATAFGPESGVPSSSWSSIRRDGNGDLWAHDYHRFAVLHAGSSQFGAPGEAMLPASADSQLAVDSEGRLLVPTAGGLIIRSTQAIRTVGRAENLRAPVRSVLQDRAGSVWLGLSGRGLARWQGYREWEGFSHESGLNSESIYQTLPMPDGQVWTGTDSGLYQGSQTGGHWTWSLQSKVGKIPIHALLNAGDGSVWLGTEGSGIARVSVKTGRVQWTGDAQGLNAESPTSLARDRSGRIWAATECGLFVSPGASSRFLQVADLPAVRFWTVVEAADGSILAGGADGLFRLSSGRWLRIGTAQGLLAQEVLSLDASRPPEIWVGYRRSGYVSRIRLQGDSLSFTHYGPTQGLRGDVTYFLGYDARGSLWAGTNQGVSLWNGDRWTQYDQRDGLIWDECATHAFTPEPDGSVWIGTGAGLARFHPAPLMEQASAPAVVLTGIARGQAGDSLSARYAALPFVRENSVLFRYRLLPLFSDWRETTLPELQFPVLPANLYRLELQAREGSGPWSFQPAVFAFEVRPPGMRAIWYFALVLAIPLGLIALLVRRLFLTSPHPHAESLPPVDRCPR